MRFLFILALFSLPALGTSYLDGPLIKETVAQSDTLSRLVMMLALISGVGIAAWGLKKKPVPTKEETDHEPN